MVLDCCAKKATEPEGQAFDLLVDLHLAPGIWWWTRVWCKTRYRWPKVGPTVLLLGSACGPSHTELAVCFGPLVSVHTSLFFVFFLVSYNYNQLLWLSMVNQQKSTNRMSAQDKELEVRKTSKQVKREHTEGLSHNWALYGYYYNNMAIWSQICGVSMKMLTLHCCLTKMVCLAIGLGWFLVISLLRFCDWNPETVDGEVSGGPTYCWRDYILSGLIPTKKWKTLLWRWTSVISVLLLQVVSSDEQKKIDQCMFFKVSYFLPVFGLWCSAITLSLVQIKKITGNKRVADCDTSITPAVASREKTDIVEIQYVTMTLFC